MKCLSRTSQKCWWLTPTHPESWAAVIRVSSQMSKIWPHHVDIIVFYFLPFSVLPVWAVVSEAEEVWRCNKSWNANVTIYNNVPTAACLLQPAAWSNDRVHKSPHKFMLTSYMKYFAKFLALLLHSTSFFHFYFIFHTS